MLTASHKPRTAAFPAVIIAARAAIAVLIALPFSTAFGQTYDPEHAATDSITALQAMADTTVITTSCNVIPAGSIPADRQYKFKPTQLIVPALLIGVGTTGLVSDWMKYQNREIRDELQENIDRRITIDDFTQLAPTAAMYALRLCGVHGRHGYGGMTVLAGTSAALMGVTVLVLKNATRVERPNGSARNSFPSGHTAMAFMGAELLRREYWEVSPWIGVAGYAVAAGTGFFRMYNNRHWLTDVLAGAGIGILSVQAAYWLYPAINRTLFKKRADSMAVTPFADGNGYGLTCSVTF
jgi:membrane-associated phospholipid phosphatase